MQKLIRLEHFFMVDKNIKKEMNRICPPSEYLSKTEVIKYLDDTFDSFKYIFTELKCVAMDFYGEILISKIEGLEKIVTDTFIKCGTDIEKLKKAYELLISNMSMDFLDSVKDECVGYTGMFLQNSISKAHTVNEFLHLIHSYIINNDQILQAIPIVEAKENINNYKISLRGKNNPYFYELFQKFPIGLDCGITDLVVINDNKLIMMIRDRGHALTIEITLNNNVARLEYFIPKLCNIDMINALPGVNRVNKESIGATGVIEVPSDQLYNTLFNFISKVPTDDDMVFDYGNITL